MPVAQPFHEQIAQVVRASAGSLLKAHLDGIGVGMKLGLSQPRPIAPMLVGIEELAVHLGVSVRMLRDHRHEIPGRRRLGGRVVYHLPTVDKWIEANDGVADMWVDARRIVS